MFRRQQLRTLQAGDEHELLALCDLDPVANVFVAARTEQLGCDPARIHGEVWGYYVRGELVSACWSGANLAPVQGNPEALRAFADRAARVGRRCSSLVGPAHQVLAMWSMLERAWGPPREVRADQPLMVLQGPSPMPPDPAVRVAEYDDLELLVPAAVAMFTEEVGYSPVGMDGGASYRARIAGLVADRCSLVRIDDSPTPTVVFKADLGAISRTVAQVQGVYVEPSLRGRGLAAPAMAAVAAEAAGRGRATVSLYVNSYNLPALAAYRRAGFEQVGTFATVLF